MVAEYLWETVDSPERRTGRLCVWAKRDSLFVFSENPFCVLRDGGSGFYSCGASYGTLADFDQHKVILK